MSRSYEMRVMISGYDPAKESDIQAAAEKEWDFSDGWSSGNGEMRGCARDFLYGGETEEEFVERLSVAIWSANGDYCRAFVDAIYLDRPPYETYGLGLTDYARLMPALNPSQLIPQLLDRIERQDVMLTRGAGTECLDN